MNQFTTLSEDILDFNAADFVRGSFRHYSQDDIRECKEKVVEHFATKYKSFLNRPKFQSHFFKSMKRMLLQMLIANYRQQAA